LILTAWVVGVFGLLGNGYCEHELFVASSVVPTAEHVVKENLKGHVRYVSVNDGKICTVANYPMVGGVAAFVALVFLAYTLRRKR